MFTPSKEDQVALIELNANFRCVTRSAIVKMEQGQVIPIAPARIEVEIIDIPTGQIYCAAEGETEPQALTRALAAARTATKPLTKAQQADPNFKNAGALAEENADLRRQIAELTVAKNNSPTIGSTGINTSPTTPSEKPKPK